MSSTGHQGQLAVPPVNWWAWQSHAPPMGWFLLDFALFSAILMATLLRPLKRIFLERRDHIERSIAEAARLHSAAVRRQAESRAQLAASQAEAVGQVAQSRQEGEQEHDQLVAAAQRMQARLAADGGLIVEQHQRRVALRLQADMARAIVARAGEQVRGQLDASARRRLVDEAIDAYKSHPLRADPQAAGGHR